MTTSIDDKTYCITCGEFLALDCCKDCYECSKDDIIESDDMSMMLHMLHHRNIITELKEEISEQLKPNPYIYKMSTSADDKTYCITCNDNTLLFDCCGYCAECDNKNDIEECDSNRHYIEKYAGDEENMMLHLLEHRNIIRKLKQEIAELKANK